MYISIISLSVSTLFSVQRVHFITWATGNNSRVCNEPVIMYRLLCHRQIVINLSFTTCITNDEEIVFGSLLYSPEEVDIHYSRNLWANLEITAIQLILLADEIAFACISSFIARHVFHFLQMLNPKSRSHLITRKFWKHIIQKTGSYSSLLNKLP